MFWLKRRYQTWSHPVKCFEKQDKMGLNREVVGLYHSVIPIEKIKEIKVAR